MENTVSEAKGMMVEGRKKRKRSLGTLILNFLMYGGWLLVVILGMAIYIAISVSSK
jgi:hypothetical protein